MDIRKCDAEELMDSLTKDSLDLVLTDPPYIISRNSGMNDLHDIVHGGSDPQHTEEEWGVYSTAKAPREFSVTEKDNWIRWGSTLGKKYAVKTQYGEWDKNFTMEKLEKVLSASYKKLRKGGTIIVWFDIWKIGELKAMLEKLKFKQIRFIEWIKTNPQPLNSGVNYLTNCREIALLAVKGGKPTFNSKYDNGIYNFPIMGGKHKIHPTQKNLGLFKALVEKHSNPGDAICDPFLGSGTTARAAMELGRTFVGSELDENFITHAHSWPSIES